MTYGTSSIDVGKVLVLLSSLFNVLMIFLIAKNPAEVIASPYGGGWWDPLKTIGDNDATHLYPRIWSSYLLFQLIVRMNWVFTVETAPALYRCVLMSYLLPFLQYLLECQVFQTLPAFSFSDAAFMIVPWLVILVSYAKYTKEEVKDKQK